MKRIFFILILLTALSCCKRNTENNTSLTLTDTTSTPEGMEEKFYKVKKFFVIGDFDGDGKMDTIFEHNYSNLTRTEIDSFPRTNGWEPFFDWFYDQKSDLRLTFNKSGRDTLHLGEKLGLFCLINIGDNNLDGKDEIAFVVQRPQMTGGSNECKIYSLCNNKWIMLKEFSIHEESLYHTDNKQTIFKEIKGYLEKHNGKWFYLDYHKEGWDTPKDVGKMELLKLEKCK